MGNLLPGDIMLTDSPFLVLCDSNIALPTFCLQSPEYSQSNEEMCFVSRFLELSQRLCRGVHNGGGKWRDVNRLRWG